LTVGPGVGVGPVVGVGIAVGTLVGVAIGVGVAVPPGVGVAVADDDGRAVGVGVTPPLGVLDGTGVGVPVLLPLEPGTGTAGLVALGPQPPALKTANAIATAAGWRAWRLTLIRATSSNEHTRTIGSDSGKASRTRKRKRRTCYPMCEDLRVVRVRERTRLVPGMCSIRRSRETGKFARERAQRRVRTSFSITERANA
jgi:hypothetical protein